MNTCEKKITELLSSDDLELRVAAVRVVAEIGLRSKPTIQALGHCLREPHDELKLASLKALARLGADSVTAMVVPLILSAGPLREQAMAVISAVGPSVIPQLKLLYPQADFHGKRAIITAVARVGGKEAVGYLMKLLPEEPFEIQKHLTFSISEALGRLPASAQMPVISLVLRMVRDRKAAKHPQLLVTGAILLGHARGGSLVLKARAQLRAMADRKYPPEVRRHAIASWNRLASERKLAPGDYAFLLGLLREDDWHNVAQHALHGLERLPLDKKFLPKLVELLHASPHFSVHIHVFGQLQNSDRPEVAEAILPFLADARFRVREAAENALRRMPSSIESLFHLLMKTEDLEVTQRINAILRDFPQETRLKYVERAVSRLMKLFEANDPHYKSFLEFVKNLAPEALRKRIYAAAQSLKHSRRKDRWERIAGLVQLLWDNHLITPEGRYLLSVALLRLSPKDLSPAARRANLGLRVLRSLIYDDYEDLVKRLKSDKDLTAEDVYYLGFHFSEEGEELRPFARAMLEHVVKQHPKSSVGASAAHKLQLVERAAAEEAAGTVGAEAKEKAGGQSKRATERAKAVARGAGGGRAAQPAAGRAVAAKPAVRRPAVQVSPAAGKRHVAGKTQAAPAKAAKAKAAKARAVKTKAKPAKARAEGARSKAPRRAARPPARKPPRSGASKRRPSKSKAASRAKKK